MTAPSKLQETIIFLPVLNSTTTTWRNAKFILYTLYTRMACIQSNVHGSEIKHLRAVWTKP